MLIDHSIQFKELRSKYKIFSREKSLDDSKTTEILNKNIKQAKSLRILKTYNPYEHQKSRNLIFLMELYHECLLGCDFDGCIRLKKVIQKLEDE